MHSIIKIMPKAKIGEVLPQVIDGVEEEFTIILVICHECDNFPINIIDLKKKNKKLKVLAIAEKASDSLQFIKQNVDGFLLRKGSEAEFHKCLEHMSINNSSYIEESSLEYIKAKIIRPDPALTKQEKKIMFFLAQGFNAHEISSKLQCSPKTINVHKNNLKIKLNLPTSSQLIRFALDSFNH
jgi:DNA-binding NarL/FixJ family response regulator